LNFAVYIVHVRSYMLPSRSMGSCTTLTLKKLMPSTIGNTEYYHENRSILRITKSVAILGYFTSQSQGVSADQSRNAVIFRVTSLSHALVHLSSNSYNYSSSASTIIISTHTPIIFTVLAQESKADGGYLFHTELIHLLGYRKN